MTSKSSGRLRRSVYDKPSVFGDWGLFLSVVPPKADPWSAHCVRSKAQSAKRIAKNTVTGEQLQNHILIRLLFTFYCLPKRFALCSMRYACLPTDSWILSFVPLDLAGVYPLG